jgi:predicted choloylglycine hydrolase
MLDKLRDTIVRTMRPRRGAAGPGGGVTRAVPITFIAVAEDLPGDVFRARFDAGWPSYAAWFMSQGDAARPSYVACRGAIRRHMPELASTYERLVELAGGGDVVARMLSLWCPPPYLSACSQAVFSRPRTVLVRNYDYDVNRFEAVIVRTSYGDREVIGVSDCLWGLLDGINRDGLAVSITFGGRRPVGEGFGIPIVVRYVLETCSTVAEAVAALSRLPVHQAYNVTVIDAVGESVTAFVSPDRPPLFQRLEVVTNHQEAIEWEEYAIATRTRDREGFLGSLLADGLADERALVRAFLEPPLYSRGFEHGFGTLYTAVYRPAELCVDYQWPGSTWRQSFEAFVEGEHTVPLIPDDPSNQLVTLPE